MSSIQGVLYLRNEKEELRWFEDVDPKTEVKVPSFADAFKMVEKLEKLIGHKIQQQKNN